MAQTDTARDRHNQTQISYYEDRRLADNKRVLVRSTPYVQNHLDKFQRFAGLKDARAVLDVGCGMGKYTIPLAEAGHRIDGFDLSPKLLAELRRQASGRAGLQTHCGDVLDPDPRLIGKFDHVVGFFMLHHLFDLRSAFRQFARLLKPGGKVTFLEPNPWCILFYLQIALSPSMSWRAEKGILNLTSGGLTKDLTAAGFSDVRFATFGILPPALRNTGAGARFETLYDKIAPLRPLSAFKLIGAQLPNDGPPRG